jgi:SHS2 domain-containing protein
MYRWVDHTAEVELEIEAASEREVLEEALRALAELLGIEDARGDERRAVSVEGADRPTLLAGWIEELAFLAESEGFVATHVIDVDLQARALTATVAGVLGEPPPLVKAVTYHRLAFESNGHGYEARVILDV